MPSRMLYRLSGVALLLGTFLIGLFSSSGLILFGANNPNYLFGANDLAMLSQKQVEIVTSSLWQSVNLAILVGAMLLVSGLPGMYAYIFKRSGWLGLIGFVLTMVGAVLVGIVYQSLNTVVLPLIAPYASQMHQAGRTVIDLGAFYPISNLLFGIGSLLLGIASLRAGAFPTHTRVTGVALIVASVCYAAHLVPITGGLWQIIPLGSIVGTLTFLLGLAVFGYTLVSMPVAEAVQPFPVSTEQGSDMSFARLYRLSGLALLIGTLLAIPAGILLWVDINADKALTVLANPLFVPGYLMGLIASILILLGLPGMLVYVVKPMRWSGFVGFVLIFWSTLMLGVVDMGLYCLGFPLLATLAPHIFTGGYSFSPYFQPFAFLVLQPASLSNSIVFVAILAFITGVILFSYAMLRSGVLQHDLDVIGVLFLLAGLFDALAIFLVLIDSVGSWQLWTLCLFTSDSAFFLALAATGGVLLARSLAGPIIVRPLVYSTLTAFVITGYVLVVGSIGVLLQQTRITLMLSLISIGLVAILFLPLRDRLQRAVNRLVYGERDNPYAVLSRLGKYMEATQAPESVLSTIVETIARSLKLPYVAIILPQDDGLAVAAAYGSATAEQQCFPLLHQGEQLGELVLSPRSPGESLTPADQRLLHDLAPQIGAAVNALRLTVDLQRSRERLVTAREEERRRLRRDLHDGLGPQLATLTLQLETARNRLAIDALSDEVLADLTRRTQAAVADIRRLVYALRPPALDELGLLAALREQAIQFGDRLHIHLDLPDCLPPLSAAVEVALYRVAQEALTNVVRHAHASHCEVHLALDESAHLLRLDIQDDGEGLPAEHKAGVGLVSMRERAEELGGTWLIEPLSRGGTHVLMRLPYRSSEPTGAVPTGIPAQEEEA